MEFEMIRESTSICEGTSATIDSTGDVSILERARHVIASKNLM